MEGWSGARPSFPHEGFGPRFGPNIPQPESYTDLANNGSDLGFRIQGLRPRVHISPL